MGLTKGVPPGDECHRLFIVHGHTAKGFANILRRQQRIGHAIRAFRIHVNQAHLHGREGVIQLTLALVALIGEHFRFRPPINKIRFPIVLPPPGKAKGFEAHGLEGDVPRQHHEVGPGQAAAILLLHGPK